MGQNGDNLPQNVMVKSKSAGHQDDIRTTLIENVDRDYVIHALHTLYTVSWQNSGKQLSTPSSDALIADVIHRNWYWQCCSCIFIWNYMGHGSCTVLVFQNKAEWLSFQKNSDSNRVLCHLSATEFNHCHFTNLLDFSSIGSSSSGCGF